MDTVLSASHTTTRGTPTLTLPSPNLLPPINLTHYIYKHTSIAKNQQHTTIPAQPSRNRIARTLPLTNPIASTAPPNAHGTTDPLLRRRHPPSPRDNDKNTAPTRQIPFPFKNTRLLYTLSLNNLSHSNSNYNDIPPLPTIYQTNFHPPQYPIHHVTRPRMHTHRTHRPTNTPTQPLMNIIPTRPRIPHGLLSIITQPSLDYLTSRSPPSAPWNLGSHCQTPQRELLTGHHQYP